MAEMSVNYYYDKDEDTRKKIDELLHQNALIQCDLGLESTPEEKKSAHDTGHCLCRIAKWMVLAMQIRDLDSKFYAERIQAQHQ